MELIKLGAKMKKTAEKNDGLSLKLNITYSLGSLGREVSNNMINTYFMLYLTLIQGLNGWIVGAAFFIAKLWDAVNDPMMATLINNTKFKMGRFRPWILIGTLLNCVMLVAMFAPLGAGVSVGGKYAYYFIFYVLWGMTFTLVDVPFWSMIPSLAESTNDRNKISSLSKLVGGFGGFIVGSGGSLLIAATFGQENARSYFLLAAIAALVFGALMSFMVATTRERFKLPSQKVSLGRIIDLFKSNDQLKAYAFSYVAFSVGLTIAFSQIMYIFVYDTIKLEYEYFIIFNVVSCTGQGIAMLFYPWFTRKLKREKVYESSYLLATVGLLGLFFIFFALGDNKLLNVIIISLAGSFMMIANGLNQIGSTVMIADVVDYGEYKTGMRSDSIMFSVQTLLTKFAGAIAMLVLGGAVEIAGLPSINLMTNTFQGTVTENMLIILRAFMFLVPVPFMIFGWIVYRKKYTLYGKRYENVMKEVLARREAAQPSAAEEKKEEQTPGTTI